jgi:hypothetical protein
MLQHIANAGSGSGRNSDIRNWDMLSSDMLKNNLQGEAARRCRAGVASVDYVLVLGVILPLAAFILWVGPRIIRLAYEMVCVLVSWPFM